MGATIGGSVGFVAPAGNGAGQDPRLTDLLRWSAGVSGPLTLALVIALLTVLVTVRDATKELQIQVRQIADSDRQQNNKIELKDKKDTDQDLQIFRQADQIREIQRRMGMR
jgi:hypothetical protein